jgi:transcriptional regulator GlxA family with amidase domain
MDDLTRVRERLADDLSGAPSLAEIAAMIGLSRYQVLRRFEKTFGLPPHAWLLGRRAERARVLIRDGTMLATAASECGFAIFIAPRNRTACSATPFSREQRSAVSNELRPCWHSSTLRRYRGVIRAGDPSVRMTAAYGVRRR